MSTFQNDLKFGERFEQELINFMKWQGAEYSKGAKEYDIIVPKEGGEIDIYEVKADRLAFRTGNMCIEYECNGKASGICTTKANYWAYFIVFPGAGYELYLIPTYKIIKRIKNKRYARVCKGGDYGRSLFYLFPKDEFKNYKIV